MKKYMTVPEVADYFSVSRSLVYEWAQNGVVDVWHPQGQIGSRGLRILSESVKCLEVAGKIEKGKRGE